MAKVLDQAHIFIYQTYANSLTNNNFQNKKLPGSAKEIPTTAIIWSRLHFPCQQIKKCLRNSSIEILVKVQITPRSKTKGISPITKSLVVFVNYHNSNALYSDKRKKRIIVPINNNFKVDFFFNFVFKP